MGMGLGAACRICFHIVTDIIWICQLRIREWTSFPGTACLPMCVLRYLVHREGGWIGSAGNTRTQGLSHYDILIIMDKVKNGGKLLLLPTEPTIG